MTGKHYAVIKYQKVFEIYTPIQKFLIFFGIKVGPKIRYFEDFAGVALTDNIGNVIKICDDAPNEGKITGYYDYLRESINIEKNKKTL